MKHLYTKLTMVVASLALLLGFAVPVVAPVAYADQFTDAVTGGASEVGGSGDSGGRLINVIKATITLLTWVAGIISIIMLIIAGIRIATAGGDANKVGSARNAIIYALAGLVVVIMAQVIVRFVLNNVN